MPAGLLSSEGPLTHPGFRQALIDTKKRITPSA
jgi:hypothetical protein